MVSAEVNAARRRRVGGNRRDEVHVIGAIGIDAVRDESERVRVGAARGGEKQTFALARDVNRSGHLKFNGSLAAVTALLVVCPVGIALKYLAAIVLSAAIGNILVRGIYGYVRIELREREPAGGRAGLVQVLP